MSPNPIDQHESPEQTVSRIIEHVSELTARVERLEGHDMRLAATVLGWPWPLADIDWRRFDGRTVERPDATATAKLVWSENGRQLHLEYPTGSVSVPVTPDSLFRNGWRLLPSVDATESPDARTARLARDNGWPWPLADLSALVGRRVVHPVSGAEGGVASPTLVVANSGHFPINSGNIDALVKYWRLLPVAEPCGCDEVVELRAALELERGVAKDARKRVEELEAALFAQRERADAMERDMHAAEDDAQKWRDAYREAETSRREWRDKCEFMLGMHEGLTPAERTTLEEL